MPTFQDQLNVANPNLLISTLQRLRFGDVLRGLVSRNRTRSGLTSSASQVHDVPAAIMACYVTAGTPLAIIDGAAPDAAEVRIQYSSDGIPTFTFNAATTAYSVQEVCVLPLASALPSGTSYRATLETSI